jgi:predicted RNA binding protein YcfA (HicA-like mRNA interferase family)
MSRLPRITAEELVRALKRLGFVEVRQSGSHLVLKRAAPPGRVVVPVHPGRILKLGTLKAILDEGDVELGDLISKL